MFFMRGVHGDWENYRKVAKRNTAGKGVLGPQGPPLNGLTGFLGLGSRVFQVWRCILLRVFES
jgi:hypothetical protein